MAKAILFLAWAVLLSTPEGYAAGTPAGAERTSAIVDIRLNSEEKGGFIVLMTDDGDFLIASEDMKSIGISEPKGKTTVVEGKTYVSLKTTDGLMYSYDEKASLLVLEAVPELLPRTVISLRPSRQQRTSYPKDNSAFLNYGFTYATGDGLRSGALTAASQLGIRISDILFLNDSIAFKDDRKETFTRLMTRFSYDKLPRMERLVVGDFYATSGYLGSSMNLGGLSFSKDYGLDPYFFRQPVFGYSGYVNLPSELNVYVDGVCVKSDKISPGAFDLQSVAGTSGSHDLRITVKDAFGREQVVSYPFYFGESLLRSGLHEYSYNLGLLREEFGVESNQYGRPAFAAFHRYGLTNSFTGGFRAEGANSLYNLGPQATVRLGNLGLTDASVAYSFGTSDRTGYAASLGHTYVKGRFNARLLASAYSKDYSTAARANASRNVRYQVMAGVGYGTNSLGTVSLTFTGMGRYGADNREEVSLYYTKGITKSLSLYSTVGRVVEGQTAGYRLSAGLIFYPWKSTSLSTYYDRDRDHQTAVVQLQKNPPTGEGFSYRASVGTMEGGDRRSDTVDPYLQYNGRHGIYSAEYRGTYGGDGGGSENAVVTASGAIAYVGRSLAFTRPVNDSFAVVKVGDLPGVRTYCNNQEVGKTDRSGRVVIPSLGSYVESAVSIDDKDVPVNYTLPAVGRVVSPPFRSGTLIEFEALRTQAFSGVLLISTGDGSHPLKYHEITITQDGSEATFMTGRDGEFYFENARPGTYRGRLVYEGKARSFELLVPKSEEMIVQLGDIVIEIR